MVMMVSGHCQLFLSLHCGFASLPDELAEHYMSKVDSNVLTFEYKYYFTFATVFSLDDGCFKQCLSPSCSFYY
jgi:hypothetical protein